jgi:hypothetical protein
MESAYTSLLWQVSEDEGRSSTSVSFPRKREPLLNGGPRFRGDDIVGSNEGRLNGHPLPALLGPAAQLCCPPLKGEGGATGALGIFPPHGTALGLDPGVPVPAHTANIGALGVALGSGPREAGGVLSNRGTSADAPTRPCRRARTRGLSHCGREVSTIFLVFGRGKATQISDCLNWAAAWPYPFDLTCFFGALPWPQSSFLPPRSISMTRPLPGFSRRATG